MLERAAFRGPFICSCYIQRPQTFICPAFVHFRLYLVLPHLQIALSPSSLVQSTLYLRFFLIAVISKDKGRVAVAMAVCEIFYHCVLGMFSSFLLLLKRTWPQGFAISRSLDLRLPGSFNALIRLRHGIRLRLGLNFEEAHISVTSCAASLPSSAGLLLRQRYQCS